MNRWLLLPVMCTLILLMAQSLISTCYFILQPCPNIVIDNLAKHFKMQLLLEPFIRIWKRYLHQFWQSRKKPTTCTTLARCFSLSSRSSWTTKSDHLHLGTCQTCPKPFTSLCLTCSHLPWSLWRIVGKTTSNSELASWSLQPQLQQRKRTTFWSLPFNSYTVLVHQHNDLQVTCWSNGYGNTTMILWKASLKNYMRYSPSTTSVDRPVHQPTNSCFGKGQKRMR